MCSCWRVGIIQKANEMMNCVKRVPTWLSANNAVCEVAISLEVNAKSLLKFSMAFNG